MPFAKTTPAMPITKVPERYRAAIQDLRDEFLAASTHPEYYNVIAKASQATRGEPLSAVCEWLGTYRTFYNAYTYLYYLGDGLVAALQADIYSTGVFKLLSEFRLDDQSTILARMIDQRMTRPSALDFLRRELDSKRWIMQVHSSRTAPPWPIKNLAATVPTSTDYPWKEVQEEAVMPRERAADIPAPAPLGEKVSEARREAALAWTESTEKIREHGVMPAWVMEALEGYEDPIMALYRNGTPAAVEQPAFTETELAEQPIVRLQAGEEPPRPFRSTVVGIDQRKLRALQFLLAHIDQQAALLGRLSGQVLEELTMHPVDAQRFIQATRHTANRLSYFEEQLQTAARMH